MLVASVLMPLDVILHIMFLQIIVLMTQSNYSTAKSVYLKSNVYLKVKTSGQLKMVYVNVLTMLNFL